MAKSVFLIGIEALFDLLGAGLDKVSMISSELSFLIFWISLRYCRALLNCSCDFHSFDQESLVSLLPTIVFKFYSLSSSVFNLFIPS